MTMPKVTEIRPRVEPVTPDDFIERPAEDEARRTRCSRTTRRVRAAALAAAILASLAGPSAALGSYAYEYTLSDGSKELTYYAEFFGSDFGQDNSLGISGAYSSGYTITEGTPGMYLGYGTGCQRGSAGNYHVVCDGGVGIAHMFLGDGNDRVGAQISGTRAFLYGETGNDTLTGGPSSDWLHGGSGDDVLNGNDGHDNLSPQGGNDKLVGGPGPDYAWFDDYYQPVTVTLNGQADDGATGEHADVQTENVIAGPEADTLTGNAGANTLHGMNGDDVIDGRGGADHLIGHYGDDTIWALDRARDYITCGEGYDQVLADSRDDVSDDCESVSRALTRRTTRAGHFDPRGRLGRPDAGDPATAPSRPTARHAHASTHPADPAPAMT